jgi:hypothetical protein
MRFVACVVLAFGLGFSSTEPVDETVPVTMAVDCSQHGGDADGDGVCAEFDLDDSNPNIGDVWPPPYDGGPCWWHIFGLRFYICW